MAIDGGEDGPEDEALIRLEKKLDEEVSGIKATMVEMDNKITKIGEDVRDALTPKPWQILRATSADIANDSPLRPGSEAWVVARKDDFQTWKPFRITITAVADPDRWNAIVWDEGGFPIPNITVTGSKPDLFSERGARNAAS